MASLGRRNRRHLDIWPGFVDALATLLMVIIFVLMVFVLAQFFLGRALSGRNEALDRLGRQIGELTDLLSLERQSNADLRLNLSQMSGQLQSSLAEREQLAAQLGEAREGSAQAARLQQDVAALTALRDELEAKLRDMGAKVAEQEGQMAEDRKLSDEARAQAALLNQQIASLRDELVRLNEALGASEAKTRDQQATIADLGSRLNKALASRVEELSRYRSEFFGRLREVLGSRPGIRVEGDRFVFQSELLFATGSADLQEPGRSQLAQLARTLIEVTRQLPQDINWVLRVDGHTDRIPINTARFPSNWELSTARATSVVQFLAQQGLPPNRLAAAGFAEFQPLDKGTDEQALQRNRRIEIRLDQR